MPPMQHDVKSIFGRALEIESPSARTELRRFRAEAEALIDRKVGTHP